MKKTILIKIITIANLALEAEASIVTMPGEEGEFGVMPGHMPLIANLKGGLVKVVIPNKDELKYFIYGGIAQVTSEEVNIVTEFAADLNTLHKADLLIRIADLQKIIENEKNPEEKELLIHNLATIQSLLNFL